MKTTVCIIYDVNYEVTPYIEEQHLGGSETWVVMLSRHLQMAGYHVVVMCKTPQYTFDEYGVEWIPIAPFCDKHLETRKFDVMIMSRNVSNVFDVIKANHTTDNIILQAHDIYFWDSDDPDTIDLDYNTCERLRDPLVKQFAFLTEHHKEMMVRYYNIPEDKITVIGNGIDADMIEGTDEPEKRDNGVLFSSCPIRGLGMLANEIYPIVKKEIPDFYIDCATYSDDELEDVDSENVNFIGKLTKQELYKQMKKHKVWFYPSVFNETFNITCIESALCGNELVMPYQCGMGSTMKIFNSMGTESFMECPWYIEHKPFDNEKCKKELAEMLIRFIKDYDNPYLTHIRSIRKNYVKQEFSWENIANKWKILIDSVVN